MKLRSPYSSVAGRAFTLVEMIVSMAILSIMLIALATAMSFVTQLFTANIASVDNFTKARMALNALDRDIQLMIMRRDMGAFSDQANGPVCAFYTQMQGQPVSTSGSGLTSPDGRAISLVKYSLSQLPTPSTATNSVLQRLNYGMNFDNTSSAVRPTLGFPTNLMQLATNFYAAPSFGSAPPTDSVSNGVVAFQWQFLDGNGVVQTPTSTTPFNFNYITPSSANNYRVIIISMAVLSNSAYNLAVQTGNLHWLTDGSTLPLAAPNNNQTYSQAWNTFISTTPNSTFQGLPPPIRNGVQVFERHIPLPLTTPTS